MKNVYLFNPQSGIVFNNMISYHLPYSVGALWSYAIQDERIANNYKPTFIFKRQAITSLMKEINNPDIAMFSCYLWNWEYNKHVAKLIKEKYPNCLIIFGGPQVTNKPLEKNFFKEHPYVDTIVNGEGEIAIQEILLNYLDGISPNRIAQFSRLTELDYPSPYTSGVFNDLMKTHPDILWTTVIETNRGCPYACTFCDWGSSTYSKIRKFSEKRVLDELNWLSDNKIDYVYIADANFGILHERDKKFAQHLNNLQVTTGYPRVAGTNWAKNSKEKVFEIAKIFFSNNKNRGFTISLQSTNDTVLEAIKRKNMDINNLESVVKLCEAEGIHPYTELILGLPHETIDSWRENFNTLLKAGQHSQAEVYFLGMLENSELNAYEQIKEHEIRSIKLPTGFNASSSTIGLDLDEDHEIQEYESIVYQTKYMSFNDIVDGYMFSHVMLNYHYGGWTQILSRFLYQYKGISYLKFYVDLENHIKTKPGLLNTRYHRIRAFIEQILSGSNEVSEELKRDFLHVSWHGLADIAKERTKVFDEILDLFDHQYCQVDQSLYNDLIEFQKAFIYEFDNDYPMQLHLNHNIGGYVLQKEELFQPKIVNFEYLFKWDSKEHFLDNVYYVRRKHPLRTHPTNLN
jgi:putative methyltransferase